MNAVDIINKKRLGEALNTEEIEYMVMGFTEGVIPDYQMSALLMAICLQGMTKEETVDLTRIMRDSGETVDLSAIKGVKVDYINSDSQFAMKIKCPAWDGMPYSTQNLHCSKE